MIAFKPTTQERYYEMLEMLPPAAHTHYGFLVGEPVRHNDEGRPLYRAFVYSDGFYYESREPITVGEFMERIGRGRSR